MKKLLGAVLCALLAVQAFAETTAILQNIKGKVEVKLVGKDWKPATEGMKVDMLATISTGFDSTATLVIDKNQVRIDQLTRLTVDKILEKAGTLSTSLHLRVGNVSATVQSSKGGSQNFQVTSPHSTASVRGTSFSYDGLVVTVVEGRVALIAGRPKRDILLVPTAAAEDDEGEGDATGTDGTGGDAAATTDGTESGGAEADATVSEEEAVAEMLALVQAEFPDDSFVVDTGSDTVAPPPLAALPGAVLVSAGQTVQLVINYTNPSAAPLAPTAPAAVPAPGAAASTGTGPVVVPPAPTTGSVVIKWRDAE